MSRVYDVQESSESGRRCKRRNPRSRKRKSYELLWWVHKVHECPLQDCSKICGEEICCEYEQVDRRVEKSALFFFPKTGRDGGREGMAAGLDGFGRGGKRKSDDL